jgi:hypothetical protein
MMCVIPKKSGEKNMKKNIWQYGLLILVIMTLVTTLNACGGGGSTTTASDGATLTGSAQ